MLQSYLVDYVAGLNHRSHIIRADPTFFASASSDQPILRARKKWWRGQNIFHFYHQGMIPSPDSPSHFCPYWGAWRPPRHPRPPCFPKGLRAPDPPSLISLNRNFVGHATWKCLLFSELKILEEYFIFGTENPGSEYYLRD